MTDRLNDVTERSDPVLVRPYVTTGAEETAEPSGHEAETWPETATLPESAAEADTAIQPVVPPVDEPPAETPPGSPVHWALRLLVLAVGVVVALGIAAYFVLGGGSHDDAHRGPSASLPLVNAPVPTGAASSGAHPSSSPSHSASASASTSASVSASASISASPSTAPLTSQPAAGPTLAAPPATDRTGRVSSAGGRCLALGGLLGIDGSPIEVTNCAGVTAQQFTLAADGTFQVAGRCATATGDATVRSAGCTGAGPAGQWRAGPSGSLVNPATGECLTDPGRTGATTQVAACTGGDGQRWFLP
jgi:hypothetical protein